MPRAIPEASTVSAMREHKRRVVTTLKNKRGFVDCCRNLADGPSTLQSLT